MSDQSSTPNASAGPTLAEAQQIAAALVPVPDGARPADLFWIEGARELVAAQLLRFLS